MTDNSDRNLLLGMLALQLDFISREDFIAATSAWVQNKSLALEEILREKWIGNEECDLLMALVEKHIEKHDGKVDQSLAALSSLSGVEADLQSLNDAEISATLSMLSNDDEATPTTVEDTFSFGTSRADAGARFRVLRPHAKGGLGEVFVAHDEELHRQVALKRIQEQQSDDPASRARFVQEAEITGRLEPPGIVPVYGFGEYSNGRPFYAMRFVHGDS